ncbi:MAG: AI-2E family transporter [Oscillospiraceae bacterium]|jgi:predicted PurR-regulated permease PerM|nr:AI-2E family transporter [Oscillospiraceae bacterium]
MLKRFISSQHFKWGITALGVIVAGILIYLGVSHWRSAMAALRVVLRALSPVLYGLVLAYILNKPMNFFERRVFRRLGAKKPERAARLRRAVSVLVTMALALVLLGGALALLLPQIYTSVESLVSRMPFYFRTVLQWIEGILNNNPELEEIATELIGTLETSLTDWLKSTLLEQVNVIVAGLTTGVIGVVREVANFFIGLVIAVYALYHKERFAAQIKKLLYALFPQRWASGTVGFIRFADFTCGSFITSKLIDSLIVGVVCWIALTIARIPYAVLISVIVGFTNIIPFFGPFIGGVPPAVLLLLENPAKCLIFVIIIVVLQQLDGNVLYPRIQGTSLGLSGFWVLFAILLFGGLFGFWGFILGVPVFAVIYNGIKRFAGARLSARGLPAETDAYVADIDAAAGTQKSHDGGNNA